MSTLTITRPGAAMTRAPLPAPRFPGRVVPSDFVPVNARRIVVAPRPASVSTAREFAAAFCKWRGIDAAIADDIVLITSEAMSNAILHTEFPPGQESIAVELDQRGPFVAIHVLDSDSSPASVAALRAVVADDSPVDLMSEHGRGLSIVRPLSCGIDVSAVGGRRCLSVYVDCLPTRLR